MTGIKPSADGSDPLDVLAFSGGFFRDRHLRKMLLAHGIKPRFGWPKAAKPVAVWGRKPVARRGRYLSQKFGADLWTFEDSFMRSVLPGSSREPSLGFCLDKASIFFDGSKPSDLEDLLNGATDFSSEALVRAKAAIALWRNEGLSKYNACLDDADLPKPGFVLVVDQTRSDASVTYGGASAATFGAMLQAARSEFPDAEIVIKAHPDTRAGRKRGYFGKQDQDDRTQLYYASALPSQLFERARAVYVVTSQLGFEAIVAGHRPRVFGQPFYAGWGLSDDEQPIARRTSLLSTEALFATVIFEYCRWYDPIKECACSFEEAALHLLARRRAWQEDQAGYQAYGIRLWKRRHFARFFGSGRAPITYHNDPLNFGQSVKRSQTKGFVWAGKIEDLPRDRPTNIARIEDGFLRSKGLGAALVPPMSLVVDQSGIYYDPGQSSDLEDLIIQSVGLTTAARKRAANLRRLIVEAGISKYNLGGRPPDMLKLPKGRKIIVVPGQVEDDASIMLGTQEVTTNIDLLAAARRDYPQDFIIYKPHPDVEAGLRTGKIDPNEAATYVDLIADQADPIALLSLADRVATMTSLMGFEALIRGVAVTCYGQPFYAGWGLTEDRSAKLHRRSGRPDIDALVHATLIDYPRYFDPITGLACTPEATIYRLQNNQISHPGAANRLLSKLQGVFASFAPMWR
jgi:capsular polysaccharide export protein